MITNLPYNSVSNNFMLVFYETNLFRFLFNAIIVLASDVNSTKTHLG